MRQLFHNFFKNPYLQALFFFLLGIFFAFVLTQTVISPSESFEEEVLADPITESRGL